MRRFEPSGFSDLGDVADLGAPVKSQYTLYTYAVAQGALAASGRRLKKPSEASNYADFLDPVANDTGAYIKAAYWLAVASRLSGSNTLLARSYAAGTAAQAQIAVPLWGSGSGNVTAILLSAVDDIRKHAPGVSGTEEIVSRLQQWSLPATITARRGETKGEELIPKPPSPADIPGALWDKIKWPVILGGAGVVVLVFVGVRAAAPRVAAAGRSVAEAGGRIAERQREQQARTVAVGQKLLSHYEEHPEKLVELASRGALRANRGKKKRPRKIPRGRRR
jgi:hypothetical protein